MSRCAWSLSIAILLGFGTADAFAAPRIKDRAGLFRKEEVEYARERILRINEVFQKDVVVETYTSLPVGYFERQRVKALSSEELDRYVTRWARREVRCRDGIFIFIFAAADTTHVEVVVGRRSVEQNAFTEQDRSELRNQLRGELSAGERDGLLLAAVDFYEGKLREHGYVPAPPYEWSRMAWIVTGLFAGWTLLSLTADGPVLPSLQE